MYKFLEIGLGHHKRHVINSTLPVYSFVCVLFFSRVSRSYLKKYFYDKIITFRTYVSIIYLKILKRFQNEIL